MSNLMKSIMAPLMVSIPMQAYTPVDSTRLDVSVQQERILNELVPDKEKAAQIMKGWAKYNPEKCAAIAQSSLDSIAYKNLFDSTELAKNSDIVKEFNKIAKNNIPDERWGFPTYAHKMDEILASHGISKKEMNKYHMENQIGRETFPDGSLRCTSRDNYVARAKYQFKIDSVAYHRFFEQHNMMNNEIKKGFKEISKRIKPVM